MRRSFVVAALSLLGATACTSDAAVSDSAPPVTDGLVEPVTFVAFGGEESLNRELDDPFRDGWTQQLFTSALPRNAVHVNLARPDATVRSAVIEQLPQGLELAPTLATVWFGQADARNGTGDASFRSDLTEIVQQLQRAGAQVILLTSSGGDASDARYGALVEQVAEATSAAHVVVPDGDLGRASTQSAIADAVGAQLAS
jgi:hypothetical protein